MTFETLTFEVSVRLKVTPNHDDIQYVFLNLDIKNKNRAKRQIAQACFIINP